MARQKRPPAIIRPAATLRPAARLRPSVAGPDAIPLSRMVSRYTLDDLNKEGYINCPVNLTDTELNLASGYGAIIRQAEEQRGHHQPREPFHIHPCLQRSQWEDMDNDEDWEAILPSVELASRFLDDPSITPFFAGLAGDNITKLHDPILEKTYNMDFVKWDYDNTVGEENDAATENALFAMMAFRDWIKLKFEKLDCHGTTGWSDTRQRCIVSLNTDYLRILREDPGYGAQTWSQPWSPGTDEESARLRTRLLLAITMIHEIAHCAWKIRSSNRGIIELAEPYLRDRPINELGYELENMIFAGWIRPSGNKEHISAPYGLNIVRYPGPDDAHLEDKDLQLFPRGRPHDWSIIWCTEYPVHMNLCKKLFTREFWDEEVSRYGFARCRPERKKGVRLYPKKKNVETDPLAKGLSPKSLALHRLRKDYRGQKISAALKADDVDKSDTEDEGSDGFVVRGRSKHMKDPRKDQDGDVQMADVP